MAFRRRTANLSNNDFGVAEHEVLMEAVRWGAQYDQLDLSNSAAFEVLLRRAQTIDDSRVHLCKIGGSVSDGTPQS